MNQKRSWLEPEMETETRSQWKRRPGGNKKWTVKTASYHFCGLAVFSHFCDLPSGTPMVWCMNRSNLVAVCLKAIIGGGGGSRTAAAAPSEFVVRNALHGSVNQALKSSLTGSFFWIAVP